MLVAVWHMLTNGQLYDDSAPTAMGRAEHCG